MTVSAKQQTKSTNGEVLGTSIGGISTSNHIGSYKYTITSESVEPLQA